MLQELTESANQYVNDSFPLDSIMTRKEINSIMPEEELIWIYYQNQLKI